MELTENGRQRQARERKEQLRETALRLFGTRGVEATSMKDLADAAGVTPGLLYHYFASKEAMLADVLAHYSFLPHMHRIVADAGDRPVETVLVEVGMRFLFLLRERSPLAQTLVREALVQPAVARELMAMIGEGKTALMGFLESRIATGELRAHDTSVTVRVLMFTLLQKHLLQDEPEPESERFVHDFVAILLGGITTTPRKDG